MRPIKIRVWDVGNKRMHILNLFQTESYPTDFVLREDNEETWIDDHCGSVRWPVMQYTGLKDKNGVEIYEGDIVVSGNGTTPVFVEYQAPKFICKRSKRAKTWTEFILMPEERQFQEVIGNIFENPELLEAR